MKRRIKEEIIIFISVVKWLALSALTGVIVGISTAAFITSLNWGSRLTSAVPYYFFLLPAGLAASALIVKYLLPEAQGHGADWVIASVHSVSGKIKAVIVPVEFLATFTTLTCGGSAGKEGPSAQIGAGLASMFSDIIRVGDTDRRKLVICGISGGFASVFGTPIAGALFGIEVIAAGSLSYDVLLPAVVTGTISYQTSSWLGLRYFHHPLNLVPAFSELFFIKIAAAGVFFGLVSFMLVEVMRLGRKINSSVAFSPSLKSISAGVILIALTLLFSTRYLGLGVDALQSALEGGVVPWYSFMLKSVFTSITLNFGGSGGIGTPIFYVGATAGNFFGGLIGDDRAVFAAVGFVSLLAGAANTPIAASVMAVELFGAGVAPYATVACVISFVIAGHRSVYPSQVLAVKKSSSIDFSPGETAGRAHPEFRYREDSLIGVLLRILKKFGKG